MTSVQSSTRLPCGNRVLDFSRTHVMGILNVTPDSFSDGGRFARLDEALRHAQARSSILVKVIDGNVLEVSDDGIGIAAAKRAQVTEPFNRMSPHSTGAWLGLTIVRDIMAAHGGSLDLSDTEGGGTTIRLTFRTV